MSDHRLRAAERLRRTTDFRRVYERRLSASDSLLLIYACENGLPMSRFGVSVSRKFGGAVRRNRFKRLLREAFRLCRERLPTGLDLVLIPRGPEPPRLALLLESLPKLVLTVQRKQRRRASSSASGAAPEPHSEQ